MTSVVDILKKQWGALFPKAIQNSANGKTKCRNDFLKKYKYAKIDKFEFDVDLDSNAEVSKYIVRYKVGDGVSYDITSDTFTKNPNYRKDLFWKEFWEDTGTVQDFEKKNTIPSDYYFGSKNNVGWYMYVSNNKKFFEWLPKLEITEPPDGANKNLYAENPYLRSLYAAYITTYLCGISTHHFDGSREVPNMVATIMRYHLYFHMSRFLKYPNSMDEYITKDITKTIENNKPTIPEYSTVKFDDAGANLEVWKKTRPSSIKNRLHNVHYAKNKAGNIVGINYQLLIGVKPKDVKNDWKLFVAEKTNGLTPLGVKLLQQTVQSFVYAVLGAQAQLRAPIVGGVQGVAKNVQDEFSKLVKDTIVEKDPATSLNNFRTAIVATKSRLNLAICPGVSLIPSNLVILDFTISGYNNGVKDVNPKTMVFGKNNQVNRDQIAVSSKPVANTPTPTVRITPQNNNPNTNKLPEKMSETPTTKTQTTTAAAVKGPTSVAKYVPPHNSTIAYTSVSMLTIGALVAKFLI